MVPEDTANTQILKRLGTDDVPTISSNAAAALRTQWAQQQEKPSPPALLPVPQDECRDEMDVDSPANRPDKARAVGPQRLASDGVEITEEAGQHGLEVLEEVEKLWREEKKIMFADCAEALQVCWSRLGEVRADGFVGAMLEHILAVCLNQGNVTEKSPVASTFDSLFQTACKLLGSEIRKRSPSLLKSLRLLCDDSHALFNSPAGAYLQSACLAQLQPTVRETLMGLELRELLGTPFLLHELDLAAVVRCCRHEVQGAASGEEFMEGLGRRVEGLIQALTPNTIVHTLSEGQNKQLNSDGLERVERLLSLSLSPPPSSSSPAASASTNTDPAPTPSVVVCAVQEAWAAQAEASIRSEKIMVRRAGLELLIGLAKVAPSLANAWLVRGGSQSLLADLTGERAHEKLVDALRALIYTKEKALVGPVEAGPVDQMLATCLGSRQHPTKDVRDAFRSAVAKLALTLPESLEQASPGASEHRVAVARHIVERLCNELQLRTPGAEKLTLEIFKEWDYDVVAVCSPSPKYLVQGAKDLPEDQQSPLSALAHSTLALLCAALLSPLLAHRYTDLRHTLAVCLQNGPSSDRPGTRHKLGADMKQIVEVCCAKLAAGADAAEHERTVACRLLLDLLFFHLRSDSVAAPAKWNTAAWDHPRNYEWAREGKVPMLAMTRAHFIEAIHALGVVKVVVDEVLLLERAAAHAQRQHTKEHDAARWMRLELLRFIHVEADERTDLTVTFQILEELWRWVPTEVCCKWLRVLADSGEALNEAVTARAFSELVCGAELPRLGKQGFNCFEALFGEINSRTSTDHPRGRMQISGREVVHKGIKISGQNLVRRRVSWFCCTGLRRNVGTITGYEDSAAREKDPFDFENDEMFEGRNKTNQLVQLKDLFDCHVVEDALSPSDLKAFVIEDITIDLDHQFGCNLVGMDQLWRVAIEALDDGAAARAWDLLLALSRKLPDQFIQDFLHQVFLEIKPLDKEAVAMTEAPLEGERGGGGRRNLRISRALSLLQTLVEAHVLDCDAQGVLPHSACARGQPLKVTIKCSPKLRPRPPQTDKDKDKDTGEAARGGEEEWTEEVHSNLRLKELVQRCAARLSRDPERVGLRVGSDAVLEGRGRTLGALGIEDGAVVTAVAKEAGGKGEQHSAATVLRAMSVADTEGVVARRFEVLLQRLEDEEAAGAGECDEALQQQLWTVLQALPSSGPILASVTHALHHNEAWEEGRGEEGIWRAAYRWQMVLALLLPLSPPHGEEGERRSAGLAQCALRHLLALLPALCHKGGRWCSPARLSWQVALPVLLQVLKVILNTLLLSSGEAGEGPEVVSCGIVMEMVLEAVTMVCAEVEEGQARCRALLLDCLHLASTLVKELARFSAKQQQEVVGALLGKEVGRSGCARLVWWLLMGGQDAELRGRAMQLLIDALMLPNSATASSSDDNEAEGAKGAVTVAATATDLLLIALTWPVEGGGGQGKQQVEGQELFDWACRVVRLRVDGEYLLKVDENRRVLELCLTLLTAQEEGRRPRGMVAAGYLRVVTQLVGRLPSSVWSPLSHHFAPTSVLFQDYLMAADPAGAPLLGWPDDASIQEARRVGWEPILKMVGLQDEVCRERLAGVVEQTKAFIEAMPLPLAQTEEGPEELEVLEPERNGLRHARGLVGLKNRRNTCYINSMLQNLFFTPQFCAWLATPRAQPAEGADESEAGKGGKEKEEGGEGEGKGQGSVGLSLGLQRLLAALRYSEQRYYDPVDFIKACKQVPRQPPLLDAAHTQDDTMTFLEGLLETLGPVHGPVPEGMFKVVEKERRWVEGSNEQRPINGSEREYLMLEIEEGITNMESALKKHFSQELMTGDNRIWNEKLGAKETVWKAPFIEAAALPEVLVVQLKRFKHNVTWDGRFESQKVNTKLEFELVLDMSQFVFAQENEFEAVPVERGSAVYELQGLIVHSGQSIHSGHYYSFIYAQGAWFRLDDDVVVEVSEGQVREESFGGTVETKDQFGDIRREDRWRSAYVLFYRQRPPGAAPAHPPPKPKEEQKEEEEQKQAVQQQQQQPEAKDAAAEQGLERFRGEVEAGSAAAAQEALGFDDGFVEFVIQLVSLAAHAAACSTAQGTPQREEAEAAMEVVGSFTVGPAEDVDVEMLPPPTDGSGSPAWPPPAVALPAELASAVCSTGALGLERIVSRKREARQVGPLVAAVKGLLEHSPDSCRALLERALTPHARPAHPGGWVERLVVRHSASEVRAGAATLLARAARGVQRAVEAQEPQEEEGAGMEVDGDPCLRAHRPLTAASSETKMSAEADAAEPEEGKDPLVRAVVDAVCAAFQAAFRPPTQGQARDDRAEVDALVELGGELVAGGCASEVQIETILLSVAKIAGLHADDKPGVVKLAGGALLAMKDHSVARMKLQQHVASWSWMAEWLERASAACNPLAPLSSPLLAPAALLTAHALAELRTELLPSAPPLLPLSAHTARFAVEGAGSPGANGVYWHVGNAAGHPLLTRWASGGRLVVLMAVASGTPETFPLLQEAEQNKLADLFRSVGEGKYPHLHGWDSDQGWGPAELGMLAYEEARALCEDAALAAPAIALLLRSVTWVLWEASAGPNWRSEAACLAQLPYHQRHFAPWTALYQSPPSQPPLPAHPAPGCLVLCHPAATDVDAEPQPEPQLALVTAEEEGGGAVTVEMLGGAAGSAGQGERASETLDKGRVQVLVRGPPEGGWLAASPAGLLPAPSLSNPLLPNQPPPPQVVDLTGGSGGEHDEMVRQLQEKILEVAGAQIREERAKELLEKGLWHLDNATMAFFDSMDS